MVNPTTRNQSRKGPPTRKRAHGKSKSPGSHNSKKKGRSVRTSSSSKSRTPGSSKGKNTSNTSKNNLNTLITAAAVQVAGLKTPPPVSQVVVHNDSGNKNDPSTLEPSTTSRKETEEVADNDKGDNIHKVFQQENEAHKQEVLIKAFVADKLFPKVIFALCAVLLHCCESHVLLLSCWQGQICEISCHGIGMS